MGIFACLTNTTFCCIQISGIFRQKTGSFFNFSETDPMKFCWKNPIILTQVSVGSSLIVNQSFGRAVEKNLVLWVKKSPFLLLCDS